MQLLRSLSLLLPLALPAAAQEAGGATDDHTIPTYAPTEVILSHYTPVTTSSDELVFTAERLFGRLIQVEGSGSSGPVQNLFSVGDRVVIYDSPKEAQRILDALKRMEGIDPTSRSTPSPYLTWEYTPRFMSMSALTEALAPFRRHITLPDSRGRGMSAPNMSAQLDGNRLIFRDTQEVLSDIKPLIESLDRPAPQATLSCWMLRPTDRKDAGAGIPTELLDSLAPLVPGSEFELASMGLIRTAVRSGRMIQMDMEGQASETFQLELAPTAFDEETGSLTAASIRFHHQASPADRLRQVFTTSTTLNGDEYTVLGAAGRNPIYVVLRVARVQ